MIAEIQALGEKAHIEFGCFSPDCDGVIGCTLAEAGNRQFQAVCPKCHRPYVLEEELRDRLRRMLKLILTIRECEDILGDAVISVNVAGGEVRLPYAMLLTRLNTTISLAFGDRKVDFHLRVEPSSPQTFR